MSFIAFLRTAAFLAILGPLAAVLLLSTALAAEPNREPASSQSASSLEVARAAFLEGRRFIGEGKWAEAEEQFHLAAQAKNTPGLTYYIGYCQEKQGSLVEAMATYRKAEELLDEQDAPDVEELVPEAIARVNEKLALLLLYDVPSGAVLVVDDEERPLSQQFYVNPGTHEVTVRKEGYEDFIQELSLAAGERGQLRVKMRPISEVSESTPPEESAKPRAKPLRRALFWSSVGVGVVGLGIGVTGAALLTSTKRELGVLRDEADSISEGDGSACVDPTAPLRTVCSDLDRGARRADTMGSVMVGGFAAAGIGAAGAVVTHFFWPDAKMRLDVGWAPRATSVGFRGRF